MAGLVPFDRNRGIRPVAGWDGFYNMLDDFFNDTAFFRKNLMDDTFKVDVAESENEYAVEAELPGIDKDAVEIAFRDGRLSISVRQEENKDEEKKNYIHKERRVSSMQRSVYLANAASEGVTAKMENGVLQITVPKVQSKENSYKIDIE